MKFQTLAHTSMAKSNGDSNEVKMHSERNSDRRRKDREIANTRKRVGRPECDHIIYTKHNFLYGY